MPLGKLSATSLLVWLVASQAVMAQRQVAPQVQPQRTYLPAIDLSPLRTILPPGAKLELDAVWRSSENAPAFATIATSVGYLSSAAGHYAAAQKHGVTMLHGVRNSQVQAAIAGLIVLLIHLQEIDYSAEAVKYPALKKVTAALLNGDVARYLASREAPPGWTSEMLREVAQLLEVFADAEAVRTPNLAEAFIEVVERRSQRVIDMEHRDRRISQYLQKLAQCLN